MVVMPLSGLTARDGFFATLPRVRELKLKILNCSIGSNVAVRKFIFIADYTKLINNHDGRFGAPVLTPRDWQECLERNRGCVSLVLAPPPKLATALRQITSGLHLASRNAETIESLTPVKLGSDDREYLRAYPRTPAVRNVTIAN